MRFVLSAACAAALCHAPAAFAQNRAVCETPAPEFPLTEANRVSARDLEPMLRDKTMLLFRRSVRNGQTVSYLRLQRLFRSDGSFVTLCDNGPTPDGPWKSCSRISSPATGDTAPGNREIGTWVVQGGHFCYRMANLDRGIPICFALHRNGNMFYVKRPINVRSCTEGPATLITSPPS